MSFSNVIEIDVKNARKSIRDKDFVNVRIEEGFKRIEEVVVLESVRQGYHTIGSIVWTTFLDKADAENALKKLSEKGLIIQNEKRDGLSRIPVWDLVPNVAEKMGKKRKVCLELQENITKTCKESQRIKQCNSSVKESIEEEDVENNRNF